jgi:hypothetical protein
MGMFDTIKLDRPHECPICGKSIDSVQTKAFENTLEIYKVGDCISHAEDIRVVKEELFCDSCSTSAGIHVYFAVNRGILSGIATGLKEAKFLMNDLNLEKMVLWYHDLYKRYINERWKKIEYWHFLEDLREWYSERPDEKTADSLISSFSFLGNLCHLRGAVDVVESIDRFITSKRIREALVELWEQGMDVLPISYSGQVNPGERRWSVDVNQDEINERCKLDRTWTVMSKEQLDLDGGKEDDLPEWILVVDRPFSDEIVCEEIKRWVQLPRHKFEVRIISLEEDMG